MDHPDEHALDRLAAASTRRGFLKAAMLAVAAGFALPAVMPARPAAAETGTECQKGCKWTARKRLDRTFDLCTANMGVDFGQAIYFLGPAGFGVFSTRILLSGGAMIACTDRAVLRNKADNYDCLQPGCPGFDPKAPGGPCEFTTDYCCPCQGADSGYLPCIYPCEGGSSRCCPA